MRASRGPGTPEEPYRGLAPQDAGLGVVFLWEAEARGMGRRLSRCLADCSHRKHLPPRYQVRHGKLLGLNHPDSGFEDKPSLSSRLFIG